MLIIGELVETRWALDCTALYTARLRAGLTQLEMATMCGWSGSYYADLENDTKRTISGLNMSKILTAFDQTEIDVAVEDHAS